MYELSQISWRIRTERIATEFVFSAIFSLRFVVKKPIPRAFRHNAVFFGQKVVREKRLRETMGSQNLRGLEAITMFSPPKNVQKQDLYSKANRE